MPGRRLAACTMVAALAAGCSTTVHYRVSPATRTRAEDPGCADDRPQTPLVGGERCVHEKEVAYGATFALVAIGVVGGLVLVGAATADGGE